MNNFCRYCGAKLFEEQNYCRECGKKIIRDSETRKGFGQEGKINIEETVKKIMAGDQTAFEQLYKETEKYIYYCILQSGVDQNSIRDIMQETYLTIYSRIGDIQTPEAAFGWMKQVAFHKSIDHFRKNKKEIVYDDTSMEFEMEEEEKDSLMLPEDILVNHEVQMLIRNMVNELPADQKQIIIAYYYCESKVDDIAQTMGMPSGTVKTKLSRARKQLKNLIEEFEGKQGIRLHSISVAPIFLYLFQSEAKAITVPVDLTAFIKSQVVSKFISGQTQNSIAQATNIGKKASKLSAYLKGKFVKNLLIGVTTAAVATGSAVTAYQHFFASSPEKTIETFEQAMNDEDVNKMVSCMDQNSQDTYEQFEKVVGVFGITPQKLLSGVLNIGEKITGDEVPDIHIEVEKVTYNGDYATARCFLQTKEDMKQVDVQLVKENFKWHIILKDFQ